MKTLIPWNRKPEPATLGASLSPVSRMRMDWDRMFDHLIDGVWSTIDRPGTAPLLDVTETDELIRVRVEVPGVDPEHLDVSLSGDTLRIAGEKIDESDATSGALTYSERHYGSFERKIKLACPVEADNVEALHEHGILTVTLRKSESVRPKRIQISAG